MYVYQHGGLDKMAQKGIGTNRRYGFIWAGVVLWEETYCGGRFWGPLYVLAMPSETDHNFLFKCIILPMSHNFPSLFSCSLLPTSLLLPTYNPSLLLHSEGAKPPMGVNKTWHIKLKQDQAPPACFKAGQAIPS